MRALLLTSTLVAALGLTGCASCADLSVARPFPCEQAEEDALQCPAGWRCGLGGECFDASAAAGRDLECSESARHCADGWRCGAAGDDGRRRCQALGEGGPYPCQDNTDCEADWRCNPVVHVCSEVADQLSRSTLTQVRVERVSPRLPIDRPSHVAVGRLQSAVPAGSSRTSRGRVVGLVADGGVFVLTVLENASLPRERIELRRYPVDEARLQELSTVGVQVVGRFDDGRVVTWDRDQGDVLLFDGGVRALAKFGKEGGHEARAFELAALGENDVTFVRNTAERSTPLRFDGGRPLDVAGTTSEVSVLSEYGLSGVSFGSGEPVMVMDQTQPGTWTRLGVNSRTVAEVALLDGGAGWAFLSNDRPQTVVEGPCGVCPFGGVPEQVHLPFTNSSSLVARCPPAPASGLPIGRTWVATFSGSGCASRFEAVNEDEAPFASGLISATRELRWRAHGGAGGRTWYAEDVSPLAADVLPPLHPVLLDRAPKVVVRLAIGGKPAVAALASTYTFEESAIGLVSQLRPSLPEDFNALGAVANAPNLLVTSQGIYNLAAFPLGSEAPQRVAVLAPGTRELTPPATGTLLPLSSGQLLLVVSSDDTLYAADVTAQLSTDGGVDGTLLPPAALSARLVPAPGVPVRDLAIGQTTDANVGSRALGGFYVLARNEVFAIDVLDVETWRATAIPLPDEFGPPRELWTEGGRGRVAFTRGYISALPTPVQLAPPLAGEATDFARMCGDTFALVGPGVQHFVSDAGWVQVPGVELTDAQAAGARFFEAGAGTFLAADDGLVLELFPTRTDAGFPACR